LLSRVVDSTDFSSCQGVIRGDKKAFLGRLPALQNAKSYTIKLIRNDPKNSQYVFVLKQYIMSSEVNDNADKALEEE